jgi:hypothetical protein
LQKIKNFKNRNITSKFFTKLATKNITTIFQGGWWGGLRQKKIKKNKKKIEEIN